MDYKIKYRYKYRSGYYTDWSSYTTNDVYLGFIETTRSLTVQTRIKDKASNATTETFIYNS